MTTYQELSEQLNEAIVSDMNKGDALCWAYSALVALDGYIEHEQDKLNRADGKPSWVSLRHIRMTHQHTTNALRPIMSMIAHAIEHEPFQPFVKDEKYEAQEPYHRNDKVEQLREEIKALKEQLKLKESLEKEPIPVQLTSTPFENLEGLKDIEKVSTLMDLS